MNLTAPLLLLLLTGKVGTLTVKGESMRLLFGPFLKIDHYTASFSPDPLSPCVPLHVSTSLPGQWRPAAQGPVAVWEDDPVHPARRQPTGLQQLRLLVRLRGEGDPAGRSRRVGSRRSSDLPLKSSSFE